MFLSLGGTQSTESTHVWPDILMSAVPARYLSEAPCRILEVGNKSTWCSVPTSYRHTCISPLGFLQRLDPLASSTRSQSFSLHGPCMCLAIHSHRSGSTGCPLWTACISSRANTAISVLCTATAYYIHAATRRQSFLIQYLDSAWSSLTCEGGEV